MVNFLSRLLSLNSRAAISPRLIVNHESLIISTRKEHTVNVVALWTSNEEMFAFKSLL